MTPTLLREKVIVERTAWIRTMLEGLRTLPTESFDSFVQDPRNTAAAESFLRRALEALLDLGRHLLARGFARVAVEYKDIAVQLGATGVLDDEQARILRDLAGYRNRMVHFYDEVTPAELHDLCRDGLGDIEAVLAALLGWLAQHPELLDRS